MHLFQPKRSFPLVVSPHVRRVLREQPHCHVLHIVQCLQYQHTFWIDTSDQVHPNMLTTIMIHCKLSMKRIIMMQDYWHNIDVMYIHLYYYNAFYTAYLAPFHPLFPSPVIFLELPCLVLFHQLCFPHKRIPNKVVPGLFTNYYDPTCIHS